MLGGDNMTWAKDLIKKIPSFTRDQIKWILVGLAFFLLLVLRDCNIKTKYFDIESNSKIEVKK